jgi:hypothetical protein
MNLLKLSTLIWMCFLSACITDVAPTTQPLGTLSLQESPVLFVSANRGQDLVVDSLIRTGHSVTEDIRKANLVLQFQLGAKKSDSPCGVVRNVIYILLEDDTPVLQIKERGGTGTCANSIFNQMSQELARSLESQIFDSRNHLAR